MGSITQTYQSLARGNYAMLDNLKLGFGGTKTEMSRLMAEASKMTGKKYKLGNFADTVEAIHAVQNNLKITGTTSKEAATTLEGSFNSVKSAAQNLMGNLALGRNLNSSLTQLATTAKTFIFGNLLPMVGTLVSSIAQVLVQQAPSLISSGMQMLEKLLEGFVQGFPTLVSKLNKGFTQLMANIGKSGGGGGIMQTGAKIVQNIGKGIINALPGILSLGGKIITTIVSGLTSGLSYIASVAPKIASKLSNAISNIKWGKVGKTIISALGKAITVAAPLIGTALKAAVSLGIAAVKIAGSLVLSLGKAIVKGIANGIKNGASAVGNAAKSLLTKIVNALAPLPGKLLQKGKSAVSKLGSGIKSGISTVVGAAKSIASKVISALTSLPGKLMTIGRNAVSRMASAMNPSRIAAKVRSIGSAAVNAAASIPGRFVSVGRNIISGVIRGISGSVGSLYSKIKSAMSGMVPKALHALGIHSPSRVFANKVGKYIPLGVNVGINKTVGTTYATIERYAKTITKKAVKSTKNVTKNVSKTVKKSAKKAQKDIYKASSGSGFANSVIGSVAKTKTSTSGKGKKKKTKTTKLTADQYGSKLMSAATSRVSALESENKISYKQEVEFWKRIRSQLKKGTKAYDQATTKIGKAKANKSTASSKAQQALNEKMNSIVQAKQDALDMYKKKNYNKVSSDYEAQYWKGVMKQVKKGSEAYKTAYGNYLDAHNQTVSDVSELKKTYKSSVKEVYNTLASSTKEAYNTYTQTTDDLWKTYNDTVSSRASEISNNFKIGEDFTMNLKTGKKTLFSRLQAQLSGATRYANALDNLRSRLGDTSELYKALSAMSPSDVKTLESFVSMTSDELAQYNSMYSQIGSIANREATADNTSLLATTQQQVAQAKATLDASIASIQADARSQLATATNTYVNGLKTAGVITKSKATKVGRMMTKGIASGIANGTGEVESAVSAMCDKLIKKAKKDLKIHSPSKVFEKQVGSFIPQGTANGITGNVKAVTDAVTAVNDEAVNASELTNYARYRSAYLPTAQLNNELQSSAILAKLDEIKDRPVVTYLDGRMVSKQLVKPLDEELGAYKKWKTT